MSDQLLQALVTIVTTMFGYGAVVSLLRNKVDVVIYQAKVRELHDTINRQTERIAVLEERHK